MADGVDAARDLLGDDRVTRLTGIGIAAPFEIWKWGASDGNTPKAFLSWKDVSFEEQVAVFTDLPVFVVNDATSACWAEHLYGCGRVLQNYAYFFVSTFIGGGVVLNGSVYEGTRGNAGAFGPLRVGDKAGRTRQLLDAASIYLLERKLAQVGQDPRQLWELPQDWDRFGEMVEDWIDDTAHAIAQACASVCAVIDFETVVIDGYFPQDVRVRLAERVAARLLEEDTRGIILPGVVRGQVGLDARAIGAASIPMFSQYFLSASGGSAG
jgi:predicted NBD/HSP70 family sugar kinase